MKKVTKIKNSKSNITSITKQDIQNIADAIRPVVREEIEKLVPPMIKKLVPPMIDGRITSFALICSENFSKLDKKMDDRFDGVAAQFQSVHARMDAFALNTVKHDQHMRLTRRVETLESIEGIKYDTSDADKDVDHERHERASAVAGD